MSHSLLFFVATEPRWMGRPRRRRASAAEVIDAQRITVPYPVHDDVPGPPFASLHPEHVHPRTPVLTLDASEREMLGMHTQLPSWLARVARGRGAAVCTSGTLSDVSELSKGGSPSFQCILDASENASIPLTFTGHYAAALYQVLRKHRTDESLHVYLSGYGAEVVRALSTPPRAGIVFAERIALKALLVTEERDAQTLWFEGHKSKPATLVLQGVPYETSAFPDTGSTLSLASSSPASVPEKVFDLATLGVFDGTPYTPLADVQINTVANVMGIVMDKPVAHPPRPRANGSMSDAMVRIALQPPKPWNGGASLLVMNLFARTLDRLPTHVVRGDAVLVRHLQIKMYAGKAHGVGPAFHPYTWATCHAQQCKTLPGTSLGHEERTALTQMVHHGTSLASASHHPLVTLDALQPNAYVDMIVEVVSIKSFGAVPDMYVTDYTSHPHIQGHDSLLTKHHALAHTSQDHMVFQIGLWGHQAGLAMRLRPAQFLRVNNVRIKTNALGMLQGSLGASTDRGYNVVVLDEKDPLVQPLITRRAEWIALQLQPAPALKKQRLSPPSQASSSLPPASLMPPSPPEPVHAARYKLHDADDAVVRAILDGESPALIQAACSVLRVSPEHDWVRALCTTCHRVLPHTHTFCTQCADEDGDALVHVLHMLLHVCDACDAPTSRRGADAIDTLPLVATGAPAEQYLGCSVHEYATSKEVRDAAHTLVLKRTTQPAAHIVHVRAALRLEDQDTYVLTDLQCSD